MSKRFHFAAVAVVSAATLALAGCGGSGTSAPPGTDTATGGDTPGTDAPPAGECSGTYEIIAGHQLAAGTPFDEGLHEFKRLVEDQTGGCVTVQVHPAAELGTEMDMFQAMQSGTMDVAIVAPNSIAEFVPEVQVWSMPFLVNSREMRDEILKSDVVQQLEQAVVDATGNHIVGYFGGGIRQMFFTKPAASLDDIKGRLIRVQPSEVLTATYSALGLQPTVVAYNELYNALQTGVVEGAENESVYIESQKFYEPAPNILITSHEVTIRLLVMGQQTIDGLPEEYRQTVLDAAAAAGDFERELEAKTDDEMLDKLSNTEGVTVTEVDTSGVVDLVKPVWEKFAEQWGMSDMLEDILALRK